MNDYLIKNYLRIIEDYLDLDKVKHKKDILRIIRRIIKLK